MSLATTTQAAQEAGVSLDQLVFEVTQGEHASDTDHLGDVFAYYRCSGAVVAIDDLGARYSSLTCWCGCSPTW